MVFVDRRQKYLEDVSQEQHLDFLKRNRRKEAVWKKEQMGWVGVHHEMKGQPFCKINKRLTFVYKCPESHVCKTTGQCAMCAEDGKYHLLVRREKVPQLEEKGFAWNVINLPLCEEWSPEKEEKFQTLMHLLTRDLSHEELRFYLPYIEKEVKKRTE